MRDISWHDLEEQRGTRRKRMGIFPPANEPDGEEGREMYFIRCGSQGWLMASVPKIFDTAASRASLLCPVL